MGDVILWFGGGLYCWGAQCARGLGVTTRSGWLQKFQFMPVIPDFYTFTTPFPHLCQSLEVEDSGDTRSGVLKEKIFSHLQSCHLYSLKHSVSVDRAFHTCVFQGSAVSFHFPS